MALEDFINGRYSAGPVTPTYAATGDEDRELIDAIFRGDFISNERMEQSARRRAARVIRFGANELPPSYRMKRLAHIREDTFDPLDMDYDPSWQKPVFFAYQCGVELPLDERTPAGVVADYIREHCQDNADTRALVRMFTKIQDTIDQRNAAQAEAML